MALFLASPVMEAASPEQDAVRCVEIAFSQAVENRDMAAFKALLDDDTRFISQEVLHGPEAVTTAWSGFFAADGPQLVWRPFVVEVAASGDLALSRGPYRLSGKNPGGSTTRSGAKMPMASGKSCSMPAIPVSNN